MRIRPAALFLLAACGPKEAPVAAAPVATVDHRSSMPGPLAPRPFQLPDMHTAELSNGLRVALTENHEAPLVWVQIVFDRGSATDPADHAGLASVTLDMMNEGAGDMGATELSAALKRLATDLGTSASLDTSTVSMRSLRKNLDASLDLLAAVTLSPTFPADEWSLLKKQRLQDLAAARETPRQIAGRVWDKVAWGDAYDGNNTSEASYGAIDVGDMRGWYARNLRPENALVLVGGDVTLEEIQPLLEARFGGWKVEEKAGHPPTAEAPAFGATTLHLVDKPDAAQSVIRVGVPVGVYGSDDFTALHMANMAVGGQFSARINLNLREDKGYTYGARSWLDHSVVQSFWMVGTDVRTDVTAASLTEILAEIDGALGDRPVSEDELIAAQGSELGRYPQRYEDPSYLLAQTRDVWRYGLPEDHIKTFPDRVRGVTVDAANTAFRDKIVRDQLQILVVGDLAVVRPDLEALGLPIVVHDRDGKVVE